MEILLKPEVLVQIAAAGLAGCAFAMMFHIRPKYLALIFAGACLGWALYLTAQDMFDNRVGAMTIAVAGLTLYSEIFARVVRMPVSVIYTPVVIPLIPGSHLYYSMRGFVTNSHADFVHFGKLLLEDTMGIVLGSIIVLTFFSALNARTRTQFRRSKEE